MTSPTCDHEPDTTTDSLSNELDHWKRRVHALPPVREEKIAAARAAMTRNAYDDDQVLSTTVALLSDDLRQA
jgi:hypothetical protein